MAVRLCKVEGCIRKVEAKGLCPACRRRAKYHGADVVPLPKRKVRPPKPPRVPTAPLIEVIEAKVHALQNAPQELGNNHLGGMGARPVVWPRLGISRNALVALRRRESMDIYRADVLAAALGMHPTEIWPDFDRIDGMAA